MAQGPIRIANQELSLSVLCTPLGGPCEVTLEAEAGETLAASYEAVAKLLRGEQPIYGVNTGFGKLAKARIAAEDLGQLQINLVRSHAAGTGEPLDIATVRLIMVLK